MDELGKDRNAALSIPAEDDLCCRLAILSADLSQQTIVLAHAMNFSITLH